MTRQKSDIALASSNRTKLAKALPKMSKQRSFREQTRRQYHDRDDFSDNGTITNLFFKKSVESNDTGTPPVTLSRKTSLDHGKGSPSKDPSDRGATTDLVNLPPPARMTRR